MLKISIFGPVTRLDLARTIGGRGRYWTTAYFVDGLLIDTGCAHTAREMVAWLKGKPITLIANTHSHEDHIGANGALQQERPGLEILAHPAALPVLADPHGKQKLHPYRILFWGWPGPSEARTLEDGAWIETDRHKFQVIYTPGHSPDHLCLYEPGEAWLFSGDLFVGGRERALGESYNIWQIIASLKRVVTLNAKVMFPGCARTRQNPQEELKAKIGYLEDFGGQVLSLKEKGWKTGAIIRFMCGRPMFIEALTLGNFARRHLVLSFINDK